MSLNNRKRVEKIEAALTPRQRALSLIKKALGSASDYRAWFSGLLERYERIPESRNYELRPAPRGISEETTQVSLGALNVLLHLRMVCNEYVVELAEKMLPLVGWLSVDLEELLRLRKERRKALEFWKIIADVPYPLDPDDAAAVHAAVDRYVVISEGLVDNYVPTWLERYRVESVVTPESQSADGSPQQDSAAINFKEVPGLDTEGPLERDFDEACRAFEKAVHALIMAGDLEEGSAVELGPLPFEFLGTAPLVDGQWIDRHLVVLAELGARVEERGFEFSRDRESLVGTGRDLSARRAALSRGGRS